MSFFGRGWQNGFQLWNQRWHMDSGNQPHAFLFDIIVFMGQHIPLGNDPVPGDFGMSLFEFIRNSPGCLANDFNTAFYGKL